MDIIPRIAGLIPGNMKSRKNGYMQSDKNLNARQRSQARRGVSVTGSGEKSTKTAPVNGLDRKASGLADINRSVAPMITDKPDFSNAAAPVNSDKMPAAVPPGGTGTGSAQLQDKEKQSAPSDTLISDLLTVSAVSAGLLLLLFGILNGRNGIIPIIAGIVVLTAGILRKIK